MRPMEYTVSFTIGALGYWALELVWRGHTHWTMPLTGGLCFIIIYAIGNFMTEPLWKKWILCAACVTAVEIVVGGIVNVALGWAVWDYSNCWMHLQGQICPLYSFLWAILSIPGVFLCNILRYYVFIPLYKTGRHSP